MIGLKLTPTIVSQKGWDRRVDNAMSDSDFSKVIGTVLKHDRRQTSYKLALIRAINDVVLSIIHTHPS
jgi:hypothetical protein